MPASDDFDNADINALVHPPDVDPLVPRPRTYRRDRIWKGIANDIADEMDASADTEVGSERKLIGII